MLGRPLYARPSRRTVGARSRPEAHGKRAEVRAREDEPCRVREIERSARDVGAAVDHGHRDALPTERECDERATGQRAVRDAEYLGRVRQPAGGAVPVEPRSVPGGEHDPRRRRRGERRGGGAGGPPRRPGPPPRPPARPPPTPPPPPLSFLRRTPPGAGALRRGGE